jgi:UDP-N-acetylglucosamine transferase subunit ALG13
MTGKQPRKLRLMLAASGGGHVRQLLDLEPVWRDHDPLFVTEDTALGRSLAERHRVRFVPHFALGQARLGKPWAMARGAVANLAASNRIVAEARPDVVISTGAGAAFGVALAARMRGAHFILIESFARFDAPSKFGRIAGPFANERIVQSPRLAAFWPDAKVFDPLKRIDRPRPAKQSLLFATVGATLPFPRLSASVLEAKRRGLIPHDVLLQAGTEAATLPSVPGVEIVESLSFDRVGEVLARADAVVCHGGTGSLITALREGCRTIAMPRLFARGEHYDDHQEEIVSAFVSRSLVQRADDVDGLGAALAATENTVPPMATTDPVGLIAHLRDALARIAADRGLR